MFCSSFLHLVNLEELSIKSIYDATSVKPVFYCEMFSEPHFLRRLFLTLPLSESTEILMVFLSFYDYTPVRSCPMSQKDEDEKFSFMLRKWFCPR